MNTYRAGIDIGSTTVKLVILDDDGTLLFGQYTVIMPIPRKP